jgi:hypothetical protein
MHTSGRESYCSSLMDYFNRATAVRGLFPRRPITQGALATVRLFPCYAWAVPYS